jgi:hypothetical protein
MQLVWPRVACGPIPHLVVPALRVHGEVSAATTGTADPMTLNPGGAWTDQRQPRRRRSRRLSQRP